MEEMLVIKDKYYSSRYEYKTSISLNELILNELNNNNDWNFIFLNYELDEKSLEYFKDKINWRFYLSCRNSVPISILEKFKDYMDWPFITDNFKITPEIYTKFKDKINWFELNQFLNILQCHFNGDHLWKKYK